MYCKGGFLKKANYNPIIGLPLYVVTGVRPLVGIYGLGLRAGSDRKPNSKPCST